MSPVPAPPTAPLTYVTPAPRRHIAVQVIHHPGENPFTVFSATVDGDLARVAVVAGGERRSRHPLKLLMRRFLTEVRPTRYCRISVNDVHVMHLVNNTAAAVLGYGLSVILSHTLRDHGHHHLARYLRPAKGITGTTAHGTHWRLVALNDVPAQVVIHTDGSRRECLGAGWVIESVRLAEPMTGKCSAPLVTEGHKDYNVPTAELLAIRKAVEDALEVFPKAGSSSLRPIFVYTDSRTAVDYLWRTDRRGKFPEEMKEVWDWFRELRRSKPNVRVMWIRGHNRHASNDRADRLAHSASA